MIGRAAQAMKTKPKTTFQAACNKTKKTVAKPNSICKPTKACAPADAAAAACAA